MTTKQHLRQFLGSSLWSGLSIGAKSISTLVVNKLFAVAYGPNGITLLSHFLNLIGLLTTLASSGINSGALRNLALHEPATEKYRTFFWTALFLNLMSLGGGLVVVFLFPGFFLERFAPVLQELKGWGAAVGVLLLFLFLLQLYWQSVLLARQALRPYVILAFITSGVNMVATWWATRYVPVGQALLLFLAGQAVSGIIGGVQAYSKGLFPAWRAWGGGKEVLQEMGKFLLMALSSLVALRLVEFTVREIAMERFSLYDTGLWQAVVRISDNYTMVFTAALGIAYYPRISALLPEPAQLRSFVRSIFWLLVPVVGAGLLLFSYTREFFILLLFNKEFLAASDLLDYQLIGDFLKMTGWVLSYLVTVQARVRLFVLTQLGSGALYLVLVLWLLPIFGLQGFTIAHALRYAVYLLFHLWLFRSYFSTK